MSQIDPKHHDHFQAPIIDQPSLVGKRQRVTAWGITLFFWGALLYMWQPILSLIGWAFNIQLFYQHMVVLGGAEKFVALLKLYAVVIAVLAGALLIWAKINEVRFKGKVRRSQVSEINTQAVADYFEVDAVQLQEWQAQKNLRVNLNNDGKVIDIK